MAKSVMHTVLVIGDDYQDKVKKYSAETEVEPYVKYKKSQASMYRNSKLSFLKSVLESETIKLNEMQREIYKDAYLDIQEMSDDEFYENVLASDCEINKETGDAYSTENPNGKFR